MKETTGQNPTIGQAAESYFLTKEAFQKRIIRAMQSDKFAQIRQDLGIDPDTKTGLKAPFTPQLMSLLLRSGLDVSTVLEQKPDTKTDAPNPTQSGQTEKPDAKPDAIPVQNPTPKPDTSEKTNPDTAAKSDAKTDAKISDLVFASEILLLLALVVLIFSDGYSMAILAGRAISSNPVTLGLFGVVGVVIGYAAVKNAWSLSRQERKRWESDRVTQWIVVFSVFQAALHGAAFELFSGWDLLNTSDLVGRVLICVSIPLGTASLTATILKR